ncbi:MAG: DUF4248 domain-containing protein [Bacteroidales bacterium]|jgi:hypothetical protein|nr:DUF4248 domain-containing protein [Bacteroidales bacterium]
MNAQTNEEKGTLIGVSELCNKLKISRKTLWRRIESIPNLCAELQKIGFKRGDKIFTATQMKLVCEKIGFPE